MTMNVQAMTRTSGLMLLGLAAGVAAASCVQETSFVNLNHCANQNGNDWCAERYGGDDQPRPYCILGNGLCGSTPGQDGCVADEPADGECYSPCGDSQSATENSACLGAMDTTDGTMSTGETTDDPTESESSSTTTGPMPCVTNEECTDPDAPFCGTTGECGTCDGTADPDGACAGVDPLLPLCVGGACVACTPENPVVCDDQLLLCDGGTNACVPCTEHAQCGSGACQLAVGRCFPEDLVVTVDGDGPADYMTIVAAVTAVEDAGHGVIVVHEYGMDGETPYAASVLINNGKTIALLAAPGEQPTILGTGSNPGLRVEGADTVLYMDGVAVAGHTMGRGLQLTEAFAWVDRSRIVANNGGGIVVENAAELTLRNCFVGQAVNNIDALSVDGASATVLYSTLVGAYNAAALVCAMPMTVDVRNSILVTEGGTPPDEVDCPSALVTYSATEGAVGGATNVAVDGFPSGMDSNWFVNYTAGDYSLQNDGIIVFADIAQWTTGDPTTDIDGDPRPVVDGTPDFAGADLVP